MIILQKKIEIFTKFTLRNEKAVHKFLFGISVQPLNFWSKSGILAEFEQ